MGRRGRPADSGNFSNLARDIYISYMCACTWLYSLFVRISSSFFYYVPLCCVCSFVTLRVLNFRE
jgi:hypothetical protein